MSGRSKADIRRTVEELDGLTLAILTVLVLLIMVGLAALNAWLLMLLLGALHHEVSDSIPALSYGASALSYIAGALLIAAFKGARSK